MISHLNGTIILINTLDGTISILTNSGIGYSVSVGINDAQRLTIGNRIAIFIETIVKENGINLYGFPSFEKQIWFRSLLKVSGVGPKVALAVLDGSPVSSLIQAIVSQKPEILQKINGLGEKVSQKIIVELAKEPAKNAKIASLVKIAKTHNIENISQACDIATQNDIAPATSINPHDVTSALVNLGFDYNRSFSVSSVVVQTANTIEEAVTMALKEFGK